MNQWTKMAIPLLQFFLHPFLAHIHCWIGSSDISIHEFIITCSSELDAFLHGKEKRKGRMANTCNIGDALIIGSAI